MKIRGDYIKKHILIVSQYYYPEQFRINDISSEWIKRGYEVTVLTGIPNYPTGKTYPGFGFFSKKEKKYKGVNIVRIPIITRGNSPIRLMLNYISFVITGSIWGIFTKTRADVVFTFGVSPIFQAIPAFIYSKRFKVPSILYVQDLWPESLEIVGGINNKFVIGQVGKIVDFMYSNTSLILTTSRSFMTSITSRGVSSNKVLYWPQYEEDPLVNPEGVKCKQKNIRKNSNKLNIVFTGNIGEAQGLDILPKVVLELIKSDAAIRNQLHFDIVGDGRYKSEFVKIVNDLSISDMFTFINQVSPDEIPAILRSNDIALITLADNKLFEMTIPAKLQTYMANCMPILGSVSGEVSKIVSESGCGYTSNTGLVFEMAANINRFLAKTDQEIIDMGLKARNYFLENFGKEELMDSFDEILENIESIGGRK